MCQHAGAFVAVTPVDRCGRVTEIGSGQSRQARLAQGARCGAFTAAGSGAVPGGAEEKPPEAITGPSSARVKPPAR